MLKVQFTHPFRPKVSIHVPAIPQNFLAPDTQIRITGGRASWPPCITRWVGIGGVGITCFSNIHVRLTRPAVYKRSKTYVFEKCLHHIKTNLQASKVLPVQTKMKAETKLTVVMCCQIDDERPTAPSSSRFKFLYILYRPWRLY